ncbi:hypothetical protein Pcinc_012397 [Petrolisthes cinctipes]|uniref:Uncharacterized protein n=1 Tax=Petrolisthes cinctipes TaxID=88211 RepID=A0AAE1KTL4_PETCI|nr:hypothetical protein Pcinc_012397 [Petrolisthes cinctipes]
MFVGGTWASRRLVVEGEGGCRCGAAAAVVLIAVAAPNCFTALTTTTTTYHNTAAHSFPLHLPRPHMHTHAHTRTIYIMNVYQSHWRTKLGVRMRNVWEMNVMLEKVYEKGRDCVTTHGDRWQPRRFSRETNHLITLPPINLMI